MSHTVTITLADDVYARLQRVEGAQLSRVVENFLRTYALSEAELDAEYAAMAADEEREREAREWIEAAPDDALGDDHGWEYLPHATPN